MTRRIAIEPIARSIYEAHRRKTRAPAWENASPQVRAFVTAQAMAAALECIRQFKEAGGDAEAAE